jgi:ubiquinone/menaquinone biosynthesis C-methylase UbiE
LERVAGVSSLWIFGLPLEKGMGAMMSMRESPDSSKLDLHRNPCPDLESSTDDYARRFEGAVGRWFLELQMGATLRFLGPLPGAGVADVGGGHGQLMGGLLDAGYGVTVTGSDALCARRLQAWMGRDRARFVEASLFALPFADREVDAVVSYRMLSHLADWQSLIAELCRVSRVRVLVDYPTKRSVNCLSEVFFRAKKRVERNTRCYLVFHEREIHQAFERNGFRCVGRVGQFLFPMALHRAHGLAWLARLLEGVAGMLGLRRLFGSPVIACFERISS